MEEQKPKEKKITLSLRGEALTKAIEIRQKKEREVGLIQSVTSIVSEAIDEKYKRDIKREGVTLGTFTS